MSVVLLALACATPALTVLLVAYLVVIRRSRG